MTKPYLTNIHARKIIAENVIFIICTCQIMYNKKTCPEGFVCVALIYFFFIIKHEPLVGEALIVT